MWRNYDVITIPVSLAPTDCKHLPVATGGSRVLNKRKDPSAGNSRVAKLVPIFIFIHQNGSNIINIKQEKKTYLG